MLAVFGYLFQGKGKIDNFDLESTVYKNILRFKISMANALGVTIADRLKNLFGDYFDFFLGKKAPLLYVVF